MSNPDMPQAPASATRIRIARAFKPHLLAYVIVNVALTAINVYLGAPWWAVWPLVLWGLLVMLHFLYYRATSVDDAWVDERADEVRARSYDLGHIDDIRKHPSPGLKDEGGR